MRSFPDQQPTKPQLPSQHRLLNIHDKYAQDRVTDAVGMLGFRQDRRSTREGYAALEASRWECLPLLKKSIKLVVCLGHRRELPFPGTANSVNASEETGVLPIAQYPWNQLFIIQPSYSLSMLGRFLRVRLTFCKENLADQMTCMVHARLADDQSTMYTAFHRPLSVVGLRS